MAGHVRNISSTMLTQQMTYMPMKNAHEKFSTFSYDNYNEITVGFL